MDSVLPFTENFNTSSALDAVLSGKKVQLRYPGILDSRINFVSGFLYQLLTRLDLGFLSEIILTVISEITSNCAKANAKRLFFNDKKLNINNPEHYQKTIKFFAGEVLKEWENFIKNHNDSPYHIDIIIELKNEMLNIQIENNVEILEPEKDRIKTRMKKFKRYKGIEDAYQEIHDSSEGAGLGIVMSLLLLQTAGISEKNFAIDAAKNKTITRLSIPIAIKPAVARQKFKDAILAETEALPSFPEQITNLLELCSSSTVSVQVIAENIQHDPGLTAQVLKLVHSAGYMSRNRSPTLIDSVKIIGLKVIRNLLMVSGARNVINSRYHIREMEQIWEGSNRVSYFARKLLNKKGEFREIGAVAGLLFELGKIILISLHPELIKKIQELMGTGRIRNSSVIEEVSVGISHPEIGASIATKWNFPEPLIVAIRYQQKPLAAPAEYKDLVDAVYLAIRIHETGLNRSDYYAVESEILTKYGLKNSADYTKLVEQMTESYKSEGQINF